MQVFKCALELVFRNPIYILIYAVYLSFMGVFMASSLTTSSQEEFQRVDAEYAVVSQDDAFAHGVQEYLDTCGTRMDIGDTDLDMQDAVAKGQVSFILRIPDGYAQDFLDAARSGEDLPKMDAVYSFSSAEGSLMDISLSNYISALRTYACAFPEKTMEELNPLAFDSANDRIEADRITSEQNTSETQQFAFYLQWGTYVLFSAIVICVGLMTTTLNRTELRKRNLASPVPFRSYSLQVGLACLAVAGVVTLWFFFLGFAIFPASSLAFNVLGLALAFICALMFAIVSMSIGFLLGEIGVGAIMANAIGNILGLVISFLGGTWIPLDFAGDAVNMLAHYLPGYWYTTALGQCASLGSNATFADLSPILVCIGILLLFAAAIFAVAMLVGRLRVRTADAGGNDAAAIVNPI